MSNKPVMFEMGDKDIEIRGVDDYMRLVEESLPSFPRVLGKRMSASIFKLIYSAFNTGSFFGAAQRDAQLKSQGWLSPEDQRPFCMASARGLGVKKLFKQNQLFIFTRKERELPEIAKTRLVGEDRVMAFMVEHSYIEYLQLEDIASFYPYSNLHETRRLEQVGVKRYEKGGEA